MAGLVPAIDVLMDGTSEKVWMPPNSGLPEFGSVYFSQVG
jgi:hypothetical protein